MFRIATWNLCGRSGGAAAGLGSLLAELGGADLVMLQEVSRGGLPRFCEEAGLDWYVHVGDEFRDLLRVRGRAGGPRPEGGSYPNARGVAIAGRGEPLRGATTFPDLPLPEKILAGWVDVGGKRTTVVSYHAPTGVQHKAKKPAQAVRVARWLAEVGGPRILAGDFNTPKIDPLDFEHVRTHWHSGDDHLDGLPGDDLLVGATPVHGLRDALRVYLADNPHELDAIREERPEGPLAVSYCTSEKDRHRFRYDSVWLSQGFDVRLATYEYEKADAAGTDHALVLVDCEVG